MTNIGVVLPLPGYCAGVEKLAAAAGALVIWDETHTLSAGPGGCIKAWGLKPDIITLGKVWCGVCVCVCVSCRCARVHVLVRDV